jgi:hypothetical protein
MVPVKNAVMKRRRAVFNENRCALVFAYDDLKSNILRSIFVQARVLSIAQQHLAFFAPRTRTDSRYGSSQIFLCL